MAEKPTSEMDWQPFLTACLLSLGWDYISKLLKAVQKQPADFGPCYILEDHLQGTFGTGSVCLDPEARNGEINSTHQSLDPLCLHCLSFWQWTLHCTSFPTPTSTEGQHLFYSPTGINTLNGFKKKSYTL